MSPTAGTVQLDIGHRRENISKTDEYAGEPGELLQPLRLIDGDDVTKKTVVQAGEGSEDYHVALISQLSNVVGRGHLHCMFPGINSQITPDDYDIVLYVSGTPGATVTIYEVQATTVPQGSSGTTTIRANANTIASGITDNSIDLDLAASAKSGKQSGSFELMVGDPFYVHLAAVANHQNIQVNIAYKGGGLL